MLKTTKQILLITISLLLSFVFFISILYFIILPNALKSPKFIDFLQKCFYDAVKLELKIEKPVLITPFKPNIGFATESLVIKKKDKKLVELTNFESNISFEKIFSKKIKINKLIAKTLYVDCDEFLNALPKFPSNNKNTNNDWKIDVFDIDLALDYLELIYKQNNNSKLQLVVSNFNLKNNEKYKNIAFKFNALIKKNDKLFVNIESNSNNEIEIYKDKIKVNNLSAFINSSKLKISSEFDFNKILLNVTSNKFLLEDVFKLINSDFFIPNGSALLMPLTNPMGNVAFDVKLDNFDLSGYVDVNNTKANLKDVSNIPLNIQDGKIIISKDKIDFKNLFGYYGKNKSNKITIQGDIKDYYKTFDSNIVIESVITNEFFKDYLSKLINNTTLFVSEPSRTKIIYKSKNNVMDIIWFAQISKGVNFGISDEKSALSDFDRAVLGEFQIANNKLNLKNLNYYIASDIVRGVKLQPILVLDALMDLSGKLDRVGIAFGREMPCEFLNIFAGQQLFKKGTIKGKLEVVFKNNIPSINADMIIKDTFIPSQRLALREASIKTDKNLIDLNAKGGFKRAKYIFNGKIKNQLKAPYVIKNLDLELDNVDVERFLVAMNNQTSQKQTSDITQEEIEDDDYMFDTGLIRIEDCDFSLLNGKYKDLTFGNIKAGLTLDDKGILKINSNKFDIAGGISSLKVISDLKNLQHHIWLGIKDIDSNLMAKTLFNLDKEITGLASGLIELNTDKSLKLNGNIKFIVNNGTIGKIGLVEYLMKVASVFRNPIVMISPATIMDIISIPEGKFDKITGDIQMKNNVVNKINIKSYSSSLSALIKGRFDMERHDASLRIYTRFSSDKKSMFGFLRSISLNSLANRVKLNTRNDANYYQSELEELPSIDVQNEKTQVFLTTVEGDIEKFNFLSSLKKIK